jgi:N-dimethylarginine dimethylaminohydrolase
MTQPHILMCPPDYYGIEYEINPWMNRARQAQNDLARQQWKDLVEILQQVGARISILAPVAGLPDLVFTANAGIVFRHRVILSNFKYPQRQKEQPINAAWFAQNGFQLEYLPDGYFFEGAGDALFCGDTLFAGYRIRSDAAAHQCVAERLNCRVIPVALVDQYYYHLDTCFCPLAPGAAVYYPAAFDEYGTRALHEHVPQLIPVVAEDARQFACNAVVVGKHVITNTGCAQLHRELQALGYTTWETPLGEFVKSGGSAKCLTLRLDGEEAAVWKHTCDTETA